jgi:hypothetical protein
MGCLAAVALTFARTSNSSPSMSPIPLPVPCAALLCLCKAGFRLAVVRALSYAALLRTQINNCVEGALPPGALQYLPRLLDHPVSACVRRSLLSLSVAQWCALWTCGRSRALCRFSPSAQVLLPWQLRRTFSGDLIFHNALSPLCGLHGRTPTSIVVREWATTFGWQSQLSQRLALGLHEPRI